MPGALASNPGGNSPAGNGELHQIGLRHGAFSFGALVGLRAARFGSALDVADSINMQRSAVNGRYLFPFLYSKAQFSARNISVECVETHPFERLQRVDFIGRNACFSRQIGNVIA